MRRPRWRHVLLGLCYAVPPLLVASDYLYWHRRGGAFNHRAKEST